MISSEYLYNNDIDIELGVIKFKQKWNGENKEIWCHYNKYAPSYMVTISKQGSKYCLNIGNYGDNFNKYYEAKTCCLDNPMKELLNYVCEVVEKKGKNVKIERSGTGGTSVSQYTMLFDEFTLIYGCSTLIINGKEINGYGARELFFYLKMLLEYIAQEFDEKESIRKKEIENNELKELLKNIKNNEINIKLKNLFQGLEDRGVGYLGILELLIKEIESYQEEKILKACSLPAKTWEETKEEYISYYTENKFETYWLWIALGELTNNLAESLKDYK